MESLTERIRILENQGYLDNFRVLKGHLCLGQEIKFINDDVNLDATYRIEADSDPNNQSIVFAISCKNPETKGLLINSFGVYSDAGIADFILRIERHNLR